LSNHVIVNKLLEQAIEELAASPSTFAVNPEKDFTRNRKFSLQNLLKMMLTMEDDVIQEEIFRFFGRDKDAPSKAAYFKQRQKLTDEAMPALFHLFSNKLPVKLYNGKYQLIACDGTTARIFRDPNDPDTFFEPSRDSSIGHNLVYINSLFSILDKRFVDFVIQPGRRQNEHSAFRSMVDSMGKSETPIIYLGDMGYHAYNNFAHVIENGHYFIIRTNDTNLGRILGRPVDGLFEMDCHVDLILSRSTSIKRMRHPELADRYRYISAATPFEYIDDEHPEYNMPLRIVRFLLPNGSFENIITNLPDHEFYLEDFMDLYHMRWNHETAYREIKQVLNLTQFHAKKYKYIVQEIWARAILYNFSTAIINSIVIEKKNTVHKYQVNFTEAFKNCRDYLRTRGPDKDNMDVAGLIARFVEPVRPGRSFARQQKTCRSFSFCYR
jgi:hypothetical protein